MMQIKRIRFDPISSRAQSEHTYMHFGWDADVSLTNVEGLNDYLVAADKDADALALDKQTQTKSHRLQKLLGAFAHQKPDMAVLEVNLDDNDTTCLYLEETDRSSWGTRNGYARYHCILKDVKAVSQLQEAHKDFPRTTWELLDVTHPSGVISSPEKFDLVILKSSGLESGGKASVALSNVLEAMSEQGKLVVLGSHGGVGTRDDTLSSSRI